jgi:predicted transcriptional regulator
MSLISKTTQKLAYEEAFTNAGTTRATIYLFIKENDGVSRRQIAEDTGMLINSVCARVKELLSNGSVYESGTSICPYTKKQVSVLKVSNNSKNIKSA